jgi:glycosyltransferase involved in cell wall biosynthesis
MYDMRLLWLASWYPDEYEPQNGDFIQRNAQAVAKQLPLVVVHVVQAGTHVTTKQLLTIQHKNGVEEWIASFHYTPTPIKLLNTFLYQFAYHKCYIAILKKYVKTYGIPNIVHVHAPFRAGIIARKWCKKYAIPYIVSEHASMYADTAIDHFSGKSFWFKTAVKRVLQDAAMVTNVSDTIATQIRAIFSLQRVIVIPNLVNIDHFYYMPSTQSSFTFLHVSSFLPQKNIFGLLNAFKQLNSLHLQWKLVLIGPVPNTVEERIHALQLSNYVECIGLLKHDKVAHYMQKANALVLFSWQENAPCVIVEALCCGLPVITARAGGAADFIHTGNGLVVEPGDELALTKACIHVMQYYGQYNRKEIAKDATKKFASNIIAQQITNLYTVLLSGNA